MTKVTLGHDTSGRPLVVDRRTLDKLRAAEKALGFTFTIVQGSWRGSGGAAASAGTHDRGGVIDLRTWNLPPSISPAEAVKQLRLAGLIAWYRTNAQGFDPHIHAIDYGNPDLSPSAARQVTAWQNGRNGLASNGPDDGARVNIPKNPPTPKDWFDMATKKELKDIVDAAVAPLLTEERFQQYAKNELNRDKNAKKRDQKIKALLKDVPDEIVVAVLKAADTEEETP